MDLITKELHDLLPVFYTILGVLVAYKVSTSDWFEKFFGK